MSKSKAFMEVPRKEPGYRPVTERIKDSAEVEKKLSEEEIREQASRCMDCGIPFCHGSGCPLSNLIPEWNALVHEGYWKEALEILLSKNNFPEFTGRICPAPCETACTAGLNGEPVTIRQIEQNLVEKGFREGYIVPHPPERRSGKRVAVIGSGPAGLATADELNKAGHKVIVYERDKYAGGLLRYGIPDFKLDKRIVERRIELMKSEGIVFETDVDVGIDISAKYLLKRFDAVCLCMGARVPRDLDAPGRELSGIHFAMDFLWQQNCRISGQEFTVEEITAKDKDVVVIGGGDTGSDCIGSSIRQGALSVTQIEIMPQPPEERHDSTPWPQWPYSLRTSSSHKEGCERIWNVKTLKFKGSKGRVKKLHAAKVEWKTDESGRPVSMKEVPDSEFILDADLVLLAMGFTEPEKDSILSQFKLKYDRRGNIVTDENCMTVTPGIFAAGDAVSGASLVVRAVAAGRKTAEAVNRYLSGEK